MIPQGLVVIGLGNDLCNIERIQSSIDRFGDRFINRIFTPLEQAKANRRELTRTGTYAKRFAAKEAASKALGTGFRDGLGPLHVEVLRGPAGQPLLHLHGPACRRAEALGMRNAHISISHDRNAAVAVVVLEA